MSQLNKAKEAVKKNKNREFYVKDGTLRYGLYAISECLLSIAISLDEKNKFDRESRAKDDERMKESYDQSERMVRKVEALKEAQRMQEASKDAKSFDWMRSWLEAYEKANGTFIDIDADIIMEWVLSQPMTG